MREGTTGCAGEGGNQERGHGSTRLRKAAVTRVIRKKLITCNARKTRLPCSVRRLQFFFRPANGLRKFIDVKGFRDDVHGHRADSLAAGLDNRLCAG